MSTVSVIVPVYNVEPYIHRCVDSILSQTFTDFDLILVDDGSPDNCPNICDEYAQNDNRVHVIHQNNGGLSAARNSGIEWALANSNSQWITFVDSDDWIHPEYINSLYNSVSETGCKISMCFYKETEEVSIDQIDLQKVEIWSPEDAYSLKHKGPSFAYAWGKLYNKNLFRELRFPVGKYWEDMFTTYKILFAESQIAVIPCELYYYFVNPEGIVRKAWNPRKWGAVEAKEELIAFFRSNGYTWLLKENVKSYVNSLYTVIQETMNKPSYDYYYTQAKMKLIDALNEYIELNHFEQKNKRRNEIIAMGSIYARKVGIYNKIDKRYKMSIKKATTVLIDEWGQNKAEFFVYQFYPEYIKHRSRMRKIHSMFFMFKGN